MRLSKWVIGAAFLGATAAHGAMVDFGYTGAAQSFMVPTGVTSLHVSLWGAGGGSAFGSTTGGGGAGAYVTGDLSVTSGESLTLIVGGGGETGAGTGGFGGGGNGGAGGAGINGPSPNGAGGGGLSGIFSSSTIIGANALVVAGAGGGNSAAGTQGALPTLTAGDGSNLNGGAGGDGGFGLAGGFGGGGAGGGYNGGTAGLSGGPGIPFGGDGTDGGPAGSLLTALINSGASAAPADSLAVGTSDPNYVSGTGGGGALGTAGQPGEIILLWNSIPEPTSATLLAVPAIAACLRRRSAKRKAS
jgi:hypothetical protein